MSKRTFSEIMLSLLLISISELAFGSQSLVTASANEVSNVLVNGDFETGTFYGWETEGICIVNDTNVHNGSYSAYVSDCYYNYKDNWILQVIYTHAHLSVDLGLILDGWIYPLNAGLLHPPTYDSHPFSGIQLLFYNTSSMKPAFNLLYTWCYPDNWMNDKNKMFLPMNISEWNHLYRNVTADIYSVYGNLDFSDIVLYSEQAIYHLSNLSPGAFYVDDLKILTTPLAYALTIVATVGGTTNPAPGTYDYLAKSSVQVAAVPITSYLFSYWELDTVNASSANPFTVPMDKNHTLRAVFLPVSSPLVVSVSLFSASINIGSSLTFTSTITGGASPYSCQWYLNDNPVSGSTSGIWTFAPSTSGIYNVYLKVTDSRGNTIKSETTRINVAAIPVVGGYSFQIEGPISTQPLAPYLALIAILTIGFATIKRKTARKIK